MISKAKITFVLGLSLASHSMLNAQDTIYKVNGTKVIAKILEVNANEINYQLTGASTGMVVSENKSSIHHISYINGLKEFYNTSVPVTTYNSTYTSVSEAPTVTSVSSYEDKQYGKNIIALNFFETIFTNFGASYERFLGKGNFSIKIPVSFGLGSKPDEMDYRSDFYNIDYLRNKVYGTGMEFNIYPLKPERNAFYIGLSAEYGEFNYYNFISVYQSGTYTTVRYKNVGKHYAGLFHLGGYAGLTDNLLLGGRLALGYKRQETIIDDYTHFKMSVDLNLAYRF